MEEDYVRVSKTNGPHPTILLFHQCSPEILRRRINQPKEKVKTVRAPRRELLISSLSRRATLPVRSSLSVRATFHNVPVSLPPLPSSGISSRISAEHAYTQN